jgi:ribosomal protein L21
MRTATVQAVGATSTLVRSPLGYAAVAPTRAPPVLAPGAGAPPSRAFAVVEVGAKQYKVATDDVIVTHKLRGTDVGQRLLLDRVLLAGGRDWTLIGRPYVDAAHVRVTATVIEEAKAAKVIAFKFRRYAPPFPPPTQLPCARAGRLHAVLPLFLSG